MILDFDSNKPIYLQLAEAIEDNILKGIYKEGEQITSTTELSVMLKINPATANKSINLLADRGVLFKQRGVGMFTKPGARETILQKRRAMFGENFLLPLLQEAKKIGFSLQELQEMIERGVKK